MWRENKPNTTSAFPPAALPQSHLTSLGWDGEAGGGMGLGDLPFAVVRATVLLRATVCPRGWEDNIVCAGIPGEVQIDTMRHVHE